MMFTQMLVVAMVIAAVAAAGIALYLGIAHRRSTGPTASAAIVVGGISLAALMIGAAQELRLLLGISANLAFIHPASPGDTAADQSSLLAGLEGIRTQVTRLEEAIREVKQHREQASLSTPSKAAEDAAIGDDDDGSGAPQPSEATDTCRAERVSGICPSDSIVDEPLFLEEMIAGIPPPPSATEVHGVDAFEADLRRAVGWDAIPASSVECEDAESSWKICYIRFGDFVTARFLQNDASSISERVVIVLHGHFSSAKKTAGILDDDYMRRAGSVLAESGWQVAVPDLTVDYRSSSRLNARLTLHGIQLFGLWSRLVCDIAKFYEDKPVFVYGLSNGGVVADHVSILCEADNIDTFFVDDILVDWRKIFWEMGKSRLNEEYSLFYLEPLRAKYSYINFILGSKHDKIYTKRDFNVPQSFPVDCIVVEAPDASPGVRLLDKKWPMHVAELETLLALLDGREPEVESRWLDAGCLIRELGFSRSGGSSG